MSEISGVQYRVAVEEIVHTLQCYLPREDPTQKYVRQLAEVVFKQNSHVALVIIWDHLRYEVMNRAGGLRGESYTTILFIPRSPTSYPRYGLFQVQIFIPIFSVSPWGNSNP